MNVICPVTMIYDTFSCCFKKTSINFNERQLHSLARFHAGQAGSRIHFVPCDKVSDPLFAFPLSRKSDGENLRPRNYKMQELICIHGGRFSALPALHNAGRVPISHD